MRCVAAEPAPSEVSTKAAEKGFSVDNSGAGLPRRGRWTPLWWFRCGDSAVVIPLWCSRCVSLALQCGRSCHCSRPHRAAVPPLASDELALSSRRGVCTARASIV